MSLQPFKDINFKISIIGALHDLGHYDTEAKAIHERYYNASDFSYKPIPEVLAFYQDLVIPQEILDKIEHLIPDGGDLCYVYLMHNWDGEDEQFDINSIEGIELLSNLQSFDPIRMINLEGIDYSPLLACKKLESVNPEFAAENPENDKVLAELESRGVEVF